MKTTVTLLSSAFLGLTLLTGCGCGSSVKKEQVKFEMPDPPKMSLTAVQAIEGPLAGYMEAVPGDYELELKKETTGITIGYEGSISIKFRFTQSIEVPEGRGYNRFGPSLDGNVLDQQGRPLDMGLSFGDMSELATYLKKGSGEEWLKFRFYIREDIKTYGKTEDEIKKQVDSYLENLAKAKQVRILSEIIPERFENKTSSSSGSSSSSDDQSKSATTSSSGGSGDCDKFLKQYEEFITEYVKVLKKYKNSPTDMSIMADYTRLMTKASEWNEYPDDCGDDAAFVAKYTAMTMRITQAL